MASDHPHSDQDGYIAADAIYTLDALRARLRLGAAAMRTARRNGLKVRQLGRCKFVIGRDLIEWLERQEP
jgi:hypothetical protein